MRAEQHTALAWLVPLVATVLKADPISRSKLGELVRSGLPHLRVGATRRFEFDRVLSWLREQGDQEAA